MIGDGCPASPGQPSTMPSLRRSAALLLGLLFLQLTMLADDASCRSHGLAGTAARMAAMHMPDAQHGGTPSSHDGCSGERTVNSCASMPSCAATLGAPASVVAHVQGAPTAQALPDPV